MWEVAWDARRPLCLDRAGRNMDSSGDQGVGDNQNQFCVEPHAGKSLGKMGGSASRTGCEKTE